MRPRGCAIASPDRAARRWRATASRSSGYAFGTAPRPTDARGKEGHPAADPAWVKAEYLDKRGVDLAILTGPVLSLGVQPNQDMAAAIATGINNWTIEAWVRPYTCVKGSILVAHQGPVQAVEEIDLCWPFGISVRIERYFAVSKGGDTLRHRDIHGGRAIAACTWWGAPMLTRLFRRCA